MEKWGNKWTEPAHIVTNGPFKLTQWQHNAAGRAHEVERLA